MLTEILKMNWCNDFIQHVKKVTNMAKYLFNNYDITSATVTWYGAPMNFGPLSFMSDMVTTTGIVFLLPVASTVHVTFNNNSYCINIE